MEKEPGDVFPLYSFPFGLLISNTGMFSLAFIGVFYNAQDLLLYYPEQPPQSRLFVDSPQRFNLRGENHFLPTRDGIKINAVLIKHSNPNAPTVVYFHGNAGNIGHR